MWLPVAVGLFALATVTSSSHSSDGCKKLKNLDYELYGTKTNYENAREFLKKEDDLPHSFDDDSIEKEHQDMVKDSCVPVVFYFVGRHAARFPDSEDIVLYNKHLGDLKNKLKQLEIVKKCPEKFSRFLNWTSKMQPKHDNLITELGAKQERDIARRFKRLYPQFFSAKTSNIELGVTNKIRTAQTGAEFLKEVDGFQTPGCDERSLPSNDLDRPGYDLDKILNSVCYKTLMDKYTLPFLDFHKKCEKISGDDASKNPLLERLRDPKLLDSLVERVAKRLGLEGSSRSLINPEILESIYGMCRFENTFRRESIWCSLFDKKDIQLLEYQEDAKTYIKNAYGPTSNVKQACPLIKHLVETFHEGTKLSGSQNEKRRSYFFFSHASPMKKLLAAFGLFKDDKNFSQKRIEEFVTSLEVPKDRDWRSSLIVPFSGNMAFVLYRCQKPGKAVKHEILTLVTEKPVKLGGCKETQCSSSKFFEAYETMKNCDLNKVCARILT